jgi:bacillolysin
MRIKIIIYIFFLSKLASSQSFIDESYCSFDKENRFYSFTKNVFFSQWLQKDARIFKIPDGITLEQNWEVKDKSGVTHHCFTQLAYGIPILNGEIYIREKDGFIINATGLLNVNVPIYEKSIGKKEAIDLLISQLNYKKYKWQDYTFEEEMHEDQSEILETFYPKLDLKLIKLNYEDFNSSENYRYCYVTSISGKPTLESNQYIDSTYYLDALTGNIIKRLSPRVSCFSEMAPDKPYCSACASSCMTTNVPLHFYGGQNVNTETFLHAAINCTHRTKDACTSTFLYVRNISPGSAVTQDYRNNPNTWLGSNFGIPDKDGTSVLWSVEMAHDFYRLVLNRNSFDNASSQINADVNYNSGNGTAWNLISNRMQIVENSSSQIESSLDIVGHELTHGVMDHICFMNQDNAITAINEEGALSEGYADIFGQAVEHFVNSNLSTNGAAIDDYEQGINASLNGITFQKERILHTPNSNGHPDTYMGTNWITTPISNVSSSDFAHVNSTIMGHWFFLLAEGGSGINDINNNFCVQAIGKDDAIQIAFNSLFFLGGTAKQYVNARAATIQAASQLFGPNSNEVAQTTAAWFAVGVGTNYSGVVDVKNHTASGTENYDFNNIVEVQNFTSLNASNVTITSNQEVRMLPNVEAHQGATFSAFITPACAGGARLINTSGAIIQGNEAENMPTDTLLLQAETGIFDVIPNPSQGVFKLMFIQETVHPSRIKVSNMLGVVVMEMEHSDSEELLIDLSEYSNGLYLIQVTTINREVYSKRIIKN